MNSFYDFVRNPAARRSKIDQMMALVPDFELGLKNGHTINDLCKALSDSEGPFHGDTLANIRTFYYKARNKIDLAKSREENGK